MRVLITGSRGFIGKNLKVRLDELKIFDVEEYSRQDAIESLDNLVASVDAVVHLAGENRPTDKRQFDVVNLGLTQSICEAIKSSGKHIPLILASSIQAEFDNPYGCSKNKAEEAVKSLFDETGNPVTIYRLPGVFGKWCRPNYNSVVATFCHNIANEKPIKINSGYTSKFPLVYVDDVISSFISTLKETKYGISWAKVSPEYSVTLEELANQIRAFENSRGSLISEPVGKGITRALYATYISYLPVNRFTYDVAQYSDERGVFVEMLKTQNAGQFAYFTAHPGVTRGGHYHHSKTEKFLVVSGEARFDFRNILTNDTYQTTTLGETPKIVETAPGWTHKITNIGENTLVVMLWASEIYDSNRTDTIPCEV